MDKLVTKNLYRIVPWLTVLPNMHHPMCEVRCWCRQYGFKRATISSSPLNYVHTTIEWQANVFLLTRSLTFSMRTESAPKAHRKTAESISQIILTERVRANQRFNLAFPDGIIVCTARGESLYHRQQTMRLHRESNFDGNAIICKACRIFTVVVNSESFSLIYSEANVTGSYVLCLSDVFSSSSLTHSHLIHYIHFHSARYTCTPPTTPPTAAEKRTTICIH